jgi:hypothetical protein
MRLVRLTVLGVTLALAVASDKGTTSPQQSPMRVPQLEGTWEILSVHRNGESDPVQVGARLTFADGEVKFLPRARQFNLDALS